MAITVKVNGSSNTLVHKGSSGISTATIPDVCKTPSPGGPVPIPYPNIAQSSTLDKGTTTVSADGDNMIAIKGSEFSQSNGDEAGTAGGVKSSVNMKEATWILYSFDVKMDGQNACRLSDKMFHNKENTVNMAGEIQQMLSPAEFKDQCEKCQKEADKRIKDAGVIRDSYKEAAGATPEEVEIDMTVIAALKGAKAKSKGSGVLGSTGFDQEPKAKKQGGKCGLMKTAATQVHENSHWADRNNLIKKHGGNMEAAKAEWGGDAAFHKKTEVKAYNAEIKALDDFKNDCTAAGM